MTNHEGTAGKSRFRWLDRWLEPRWRALLTWVALAGTTATALQVGGDNLIYSAVDYRTIPWFSTILFITNWFPPIILRVGAMRSLIWVAVAVVFGTRLALSEFPKIASFSSINPEVFHAFMNAVVYVHFFGLAGFAAIKLRSRPWLAPVGGVVAALVGSWLFNAIELHWGIFAVTSSIYGAVMLYGTDPLPRRPDE